MPTPAGRGLFDPKFSAIDEIGARFSTVSPETALRSLIRHLLW
jgi:hypothetical protein